MTFKEALERCSQEKLIELAVDRYEPKEKLDTFKSAYSAILRQLLELGEPEADKKLNGVHLVFEETGFDYDLDKGLEKWKQVNTSYYDFENKAYMALDFTPFDSWLYAPISSISLAMLDIHTCVFALLKDMLFYTNIYGALDTTKPLETDTKEALDEVKSRLDEIESGKVTPVGNPAVPDADQFDMNEFSNAFLKALYPEEPDDVIEAIKKLDEFTAFLELDVSSAAQNVVLGGKPNEIAQPTEDVIEAFNFLEEYRLETGRTNEKTTLIEVLNR